MFVDTEIKLFKYLGKHMLFSNGHINGYCYIFFYYISLNKLFLEKLLLKINSYNLIIRFLIIKKNKGFFNKFFMFLINLKFINNFLYENFLIKKRSLLQINLKNYRFIVILIKYLRILNVIPYYKPISIIVNE